jgi:hypothetical protein
MEKQIIINAIVALNGTLSALTVVDEKEAVKEVTEKILELVKQL